ncbi:hypothetical protein N7501_004237 [Penicillium viridicatum]|uniref:Uncharacterized protein n=1 Tax=Penicillium cf. viridicatum TaxID=2972119 RepID=A0A9W9T4Q4_9EURO|nr:hypothetical protein N7449_003813 [Penicillium cf. viridicatum]KAJ5967989.1 hypothetical protein N7501_004237 [Penicillium viridicatum]
MDLYERLSWPKSRISTPSEFDSKEESEGLLQQTSLLHPRGTRLRKTLAGISAVLMLIVLMQSIIILRMSKGVSGQLPKTSPNGLSYARDKERLAHVPTRFWNGDEDEEDKSWTAIEGGHGLVSVSPEWASERGLPETLVHPRDPSKRVYVIEAYHSIHCLQTLRRHYLNLRRGETPDRPMEHDLHCFDSLRQSVMCQANDELLYTTGHNDAGINQTRMCRDWDALREWATGFTSCYHDYVAPPGETKWGKCDNGMDGLPYGSLLS